MGTFSIVKVQLGGYLLVYQKQQNAHDYLQYCRACSHLADQMSLSLRDLDRALWAKSWEDSLLDLINE